MTLAPWCRQEAANVIAEENWLNEHGNGSLRVGTDLVPVGEVADSVARFGDRYVGRIYTDHEFASCCQGTPSVVAAGLAARFAAKEATIKVLRPVGQQPDWRSIEIRRDQRAGALSP